MYKIKNYFLIIGGMMLVFSHVFSGVLKTIGMYFLWEKIPSFWWWTLWVTFFVIYVAGLSHGQLTEEDDLKTKIFWYRVRDIVPVLNFFIIIIMFVYVTIF